MVNRNHVGIAVLLDAPSTEIGAIDGFLTRPPPFNLILNPIGF
jgi:hypothetical protein